LKQGLQASCRLATTAWLESGGVNAELDEPNKATKGLFKAAAMCIKPESLVTTAWLEAIKSIASAS